MLITDLLNRALVVRKHNTTSFMQPGGKPEPGESAEQAAVRELAEELGLSITQDQLHPLGRFTTEAANEANTTLIADCFSLILADCEVLPASEIAEARWITPEDKLPLAPLAAQFLLPLVWG